MSVEDVLKSGYVATARRVERVMASSGLGPMLDARVSQSRTAHWLRSLTAIHDLDAMIRLDVPWWTYRAIDRIDGFLRSRPDARVFEYGSGASTIWLSRRAGQVTSIEHHAEWHERMQAALAMRLERAKVDLRLVAPDDTPDPDVLYHSAKARTAGKSYSAYARSIDAAAGPFDLVVVDGRARPACLRHALDHLALDGLIVFDNSNRRRYQASLASAGLPIRRFAGRAPSLPHRDETALLGPVAP